MRVGRGAVEQPEREGVENGFRKFAGIVITEEIVHQLLQQRFEARPIAVQQRV